MTSDRIGVSHCAIFSNARKNLRQNCIDKLTRTPCNRFLSYGGDLIDIDYSYTRHLLDGDRYAVPTCISRADKLAYKQVCIILSVAITGGGTLQAQVYITCIYIRVVVVIYIYTHTRICMLLHRPWPPGRPVYMYEYHVMVSGNFTKPNGFSHACA